MTQKIELPGTGLTVSPLCLGTMPLGERISEADSHALLDRYVALGGNFLDSARIYSDWHPPERRRSERIIGDWLRARRNRGSLVIATKGAHPFIESLDVPRTSAPEIRDDLEGSLRTLGTDVIDLYWLHRDDVSRPVEHYVDLLNGFIREGKIRAFGASNWTGERMRAANAYARASGQAGFSANQPLWSLGSWLAAPPPYKGIVKFDADAYRFHRESGLAVLPYTAQANGFFTKLALPEGRRPAGLEKSNYHIPANLAAGRVAARIAEARGVTINAVVLAYLWSRPFPVIPIIGSQTPAQVEDSFRALPLRLTLEELRSLEEASPSGLPVET
jgi:aryl-alcohol dehydrogenase-like predicted oxidoreductase